MDSDAFDEWLNQFAHLSDTETMNLPQWQHAIAFIHQFALSRVNDGAGSLYYNHTENIDNVAKSFDAIGEDELSEKVREVWAILEPFVADYPPEAQDILIKQCLNGAATSELLALEALLDRRWGIFYGKLEAQARSNGWKP